MERPEYSVARSCRNCHYFKQRSKASHLLAEGFCKLPQVADKKADKWPAHAFGFCAGHTWRAKGRTVHKISLKYKMTIPEDTL